MLLTVPYLCQCWGPLCFNPLLSSFVWQLKNFLFPNLISVQTLRLLFSLCPIVFTLLLVFSNFDFPLLLDTAAPALPLSLAHCLSDELAPFFSFFSLLLLPNTLPPSLFPSLSKTAAGSFSCSLSSTTY